MGWLISSGPPVLLGTYVNELLQDYGAYEAEIAGDPAEITKENLKRENHAHEHIDVWFLFKTPKDGKPVIGLFLIDFDATAKETGGLPVFDDASGAEYPYESPLVQAWGYRVLDSGSGFGSHTCPMRFLDAAPVVRGEHDAAWREEMRRLKGTLL